MGCRRTTLFLAAVAVAVTACSEQQDQQPAGISGPGTATADAHLPSVCDFNAIQQNIISYFPGNRQSGILALKRSMESAGEDTEAGRTYGFEIMDSVGFFSRQFSVNTTVGAQLTIGLIACMFVNQDTIEYPIDPTLAFSNALAKVDGGAYYVRGGGREGVVLGTEHPAVGSPDNLSGLEPSSGNWATSLGGNAVSEGRALIYGYRTASGPLVYEWASVPSGATFSPALVVSVCDEDESATAMIHESNVGVLAYAATDLCAETQALTLDESGWGSTLLASRFARAVTELLSPQPLQATALGKSGSGGTATTFKSKFSKKSVSSLRLAYVADKPPSNVAVSPATFPVEVRVSAREGNTSLAVLGVCVYLTGSNNNGQPTEVLGPQDERCDDDRPEGIPETAPSAVTEEFTTAQSTADFGNAVHVSKTGGLILTATAKVIGRDGTGAVSKKINVKPK